MMGRRNLPWVLAAGLVLAGAGPSAASDLRQVFSAPLKIERTGPVTSTPLELRMGKLFVRGAVNGQDREFLFDTGSPTVLTRAFADSLGLKPIGRNVGVDANGATVPMDVAVAETISLGGVTFHNVPVLIFDYSSLSIGGCIVDGGILGSEILPGSAWRIDTEAGALTIAADASAFDAPAPGLGGALHDVGYPHAPIIDYRIGELTDKAMFDTGSAEVLSLYRRAAESPAVTREITAGSRRNGRGTEGESAGGRGPLRDLARFQLDELELERGSLSDVPVVTRTAPPTLLGAGVLATHVVTLDYPGERFVLSPRLAPAPRRAPADFAVALNGEDAEVVQLYEGPAARAGLRLGDHLKAADGQPIGAAAKCDTARWLVESFDPAAITELVVERNGEQRTIRIPPRTDSSRGP